MWRSVALVLVVGGCQPPDNYVAPFHDAGSTGGGTGTGGGGQSGAGGSGGGKPASCVPTKTCSSAGKNCGTFYTGCAQVNCGTCAYPTTCGGSDYAAWKNNEVPNVCGVW